MRHIVGVADMKISGTPGDVIVTHALGSCLGVAVHDSHARVGGLLHVMMPQASINPDKAAANPYMFVDSGLPAFFHSLYAAGALKGRMVVKVAGGSNVQALAEDRFAIGTRNYVLLREVLCLNGALSATQEVVGPVPPRM